MERLQEERKMMHRVAATAADAAAAMRCRTACCSGAAGRRRDRRQSTLRRSRHRRDWPPAGEIRRLRGDDHTRTLLQRCPSSRRRSRPPRKSQVHRRPAPHTAGEVESLNARDSRGQQVQTRSRREGSWQEMRCVMDRWSSVERAAY